MVKKYAQSHSQRLQLDHVKSKGTFKHLDLRGHDEDCGGPYRLERTCSGKENFHASTYQVGSLKGHLHRPNVAPESS